MVKVKLGQVGGEVKEIELPEGSTIGEAVDKAEMPSDGFDFRMDGDFADRNTLIPSRDGQNVVTMVPGIKAGMVDYEW